MVLNFMPAVRFIWLCLIIVLGSCAAPEVEKKPVNTVWPLPPAEPKIKFIEEISSKEDVEEITKSEFLKSLIAGPRDVKNRLVKPYGIAIDKGGRLYVTDIGRVFVFDKRNKSLLFVGDKPDAGQLKMPICVAISPDGRIYVSDAVYGKVFIYKSDGKFLGEIGRADELKGPAGIAIDPVRERIYVVNTKKNSVMAYTVDGRFLFSIGDHPEDKYKLSLPTNITVDSEGNIYVVDTGNFRVHIFNADGKLSRTIEGGKKGSFIRPKGIAVDSEGNIYVVDAAAQKFFVFDKEGNFSLSVGKGGIEPGQFSVPAGITVDDEDRIYVADQMNGRIQIFQCLSKKWQSAQQSQKQTNGQ